MGHLSVKITVLKIYRKFSLRKKNIYFNPQSRKFYGDSSVTQKKASQSFLVAEGTAEKKMQ